MIKKVSLTLGYKCNNNCRICAVANKRKWGDRTTREVESELEQIKNPQNKSLVLTGGEVTIRKDIFEIIRYAKFLGFKKIEIQTNGRMCSQLNFTQRLIKEGVNTFLVSIHGHNKKTHDFITRCPGSFLQTTAGIKNLTKFKINLITNTVVNKFNYRYLPKIAKLLIGLGVKRIQFTFVHGLGNAWNNFGQVVPTYSESAPYIHKAIDLCRKYNITSPVRDVPFCFMRGYENHINDPYLEHTTVRDMRRNITDFKTWRPQYAKIQGPPCEKCKYRKICEGPWKDYVKKYGWSEFCPLI